MQPDGSSTAPTSPASNPVAKTPAATQSELLAPATSSECLIAAAAHLGMFAGFWFLAPLAIYFWKRDSSRFVTFHAVQAMLLCCIQVGVTAMASLLASVGYVARVIGAQLVDKQTMLVVMLSVLFALAVVMFSVPTVLSLIAGFRAFEGKRWKMPLIGAAAERWFHRYLAEHGQLTQDAKAGAAQPNAQ